MTVPAQAPRHHLPQDVLAEYAAGNSPVAIALFVQSHLALCPRCRDDVHAYDALGGACLVEAPAARVGEAGLQALLARLDEPETKPAERGDELPPWLPPPLREAVAAAGGLRWRWVIPGVRFCDLPVADERLSLRLVRQRSGLVIPEHDHEGEEYTMVLSGGLRDGDMQVGPGDAVVRGSGHRHSIAVDRGAPCYALQINEGDLLPQTLLGRMLKALART